MKPVLRLSALLARSGRVPSNVLLRSCAPTVTAVRFLAVKPEVQSGVAVSSKKKEATDLASVLAREIQYEKEDPTSEAKLAEIAASMEQFKVEDAAGTSRFALTRQIGGLAVRIDVDCAPVPTDEEEEAENDDGEEGAWQCLQLF